MKTEHIYICIILYVYIVILLFCNVYNIKNLENTKLDAPKDGCSYETAESQVGTITTRDGYEAKLLVYVCPIKGLFLGTIPATK